MHTNIIRRFVSYDTKKIAILRHLNRKIRGSDTHVCVCVSDDMYIIDG